MGAVKTFAVDASDGLCERCRDWDGDGWVCWGVCVPRMVDWSESQCTDDCTLGGSPPAGEWFDGDVNIDVAMAYLCTRYKIPLMMPKVMKRRMSMPCSKDRFSRTQDLSGRPWRSEAYSVIRVSEEILGSVGGWSRVSKMVVGVVRLRAMFRFVLVFAVAEEETETSLLWLASELILDRSTPPLSLSLPIFTLPFPNWMWGTRTYLAHSSCTL